MLRYNASCKHGTSDNTPTLSAGVAPDTTLKSDTTWARRRTHPLDWLRMMGGGPAYSNTTTWRGGNVASTILGQCRFRYGKSNAKKNYSVLKLRRVDAWLTCCTTTTTTTSYTTTALLIVVRYRSGCSWTRRWRRHRIVVHLK